MWNESCLKKQEEVVRLFASCPTLEAKYEQIIALGKTNPPLSAEKKIAEHLVAGCQSQMYFYTELEGDVLRFHAESDALISSGLAAILIRAYDGETPEVILKCPPTYLEQLGIQATLTPNRSNGLYSIHLRMKQDALKYYMQLHNKSKDP